MLSSRMSLGPLLGLILVGSVHAEPASVGTVTATSTEKGERDLYAAWRAVDGEATTPWCEGAAGDGVGEALVITYSAPLHIDEIQVTVGMWSQGKPDAQWNVPSRLQLSVDGATPRAMKIDRGGEGTITIGAEVRELRLSFAKVQPGEQQKHVSCIAEVNVTPGETGSLPWMVAYVPEGETGRVLSDGVEAIASALEKCDRKALAKLVKLPFRATWGDERVTVFKKAARLATACRKGDLPPFESDSGEGPVQCRPGASPDDIDCRVPWGSNYGEAFWSLAWSSGVWRLVGVEYVQTVPAPD